MKLTREVILPGEKEPVIKLYPTLYGNWTPDPAWACITWGLGLFSIFWMAQQLFF